MWALHLWDEYPFITQLQDLLQDTAHYNKKYSEAFTQSMSAQVKDKVGRENNSTQWEVENLHLLSFS